MSVSPETEPGIDAMNAIPEYKYQSTLLGTLSSMEFLIGVPLNFMVLSFFLQKSSRSNSRLIYLGINTADSVMCSSALFHVMDFFSSYPGVLSQNVGLCTVHSIVWVISAKLSVFLIMVLSISRTISMVFPLIVIPRKYLSVPVLCYLALQVVQNTIPFWFGQHYVYWKPGNLCAWSVDILKPYLDPVFIEIIRHSLHTFQFTFPSIIIIVCCCISLIRLKTSASISHGLQRKRRATVTMLYITAVFLIFNVPFVISTIIFAIERTAKKPVLAQHMSVEQSSLLWNLMFHTHYFNSIGNAVIYIIRVKGLREYGCQVFRRLNCRLVLLSRG